MKRATVLLTALILILLSSATVFAAGVDLTGVGARATAMGGNYRAIANDWSAMYWNPAGLVATKGLNVGFSVEYVVPRATYQAGPSQYFNTTGEAAYKNFGAAYEFERAADPQEFVVPSGGVTFSTGKLAFGVGVWAPFGLGSKWDLLRTASNNLGNVPGVFFDEYNDAYPKFEYESDMQIIDIHPTISYQISDKLSVGAGASVVMGDIAIRQPVFVQNPYLYNTALYEQLLAISTEGGLIQALNQMRRPPFDHLINEVEMTGTGNSFGGNLGVMFKATENLTVGASVQYYTDLELDGEYNQTTYFANAPNLHGVAQFYADSVFSKMYAAGLLSAQQYGVLSNFYSGQVLPAVNSDAKASVPLPMKLGVGFSYTGFKNLLLAADFTYTQWSAWDIIPITDANGAAVADLVENWNDTFKVGLGFEWTAGAAKIRGGLSTENRAATEETMQASIPDINRRINLNAGLALPVGPLMFSVNYEKIFIADETISTWYNQGGIEENMAGTYTMNVNNLMVGVDLNF